VADLDFEEEVAVEASSGSAAALPRRRHATAGEFIVQALRSDILTGQIHAGEPLLLDELAERFGTSVIPIREALRALEVQKLVVLRAHRTAHVAPLSLDELRDLYRVRLLLDVEAVRLAHGKFTPNDLNEIRALIDAMEERSLAGDVLGAADAHTAVHFSIYSAADSPVLLDILRRLWDEMTRYRHAIRNYRGNHRAWANEHRRLVDLLEHGDADSAAAEMVAHIERALEVLIKALALQSRPPPIHQQSTA